MISLIKDIKYKALLIKKLKIYATIKIITLYKPKLL